MNEIHAVALVLLVLVHYYPPKIYTNWVIGFLISVNLVLWFQLLKEAIGV